MPTRSWSGTGKWKPLLTRAVWEARPPIDEQISQTLTDVVVTFLREDPQWSSLFFAAFSGQSGRFA